MGDRFEAIPNPGVATMAAMTAATVLAREEPREPEEATEVAAEGTHHGIGPLTRAALRTGVPYLLDKRMLL